MSTATDSTPCRVRRRADWDAIEAAYVRGIEVDGKPRFPSLDEIAVQFAVSRSQAAYHSRRKRWPQKREAFRTELGLESYRRGLERRLEENEKFDDISLKVAKFAINKVDRSA